MAIKKPLVIGTNGLPQQIQSGDTITVPNSGTDLQGMINGEAGAVVIGAPMYISAAGTVKKAQSNAAGTADVFGLMFDVSTAAAASGQVAKNGLVTATTGQWDAVTGQTGGLTFGAKYFLDPATAGRMTTTPPTTVGQLVVLLGTAQSSTEMDVDIQSEVLL
jgi:hypothetical protein